MHNKDHITIGGKLSEMLGLECPISEFEKIGKKFMEQTGHNDEHKLAKQISFFEWGLDVLEFALNSINLFEKSKTVTIIEDNAKCAFTMYNGYKSDKEPAMVQELLEYASQFVLLSDLESMGERAGEDLLYMVIQRINNRVPILTRAGCKYAGDYIMAKEETIEKNKTLYESIGFRDINLMVGGYIDSVTMIYCHDDLYKKIMAG